MDKMMEVLCTIWTPGYGGDVPSIGRIVDECWCEEKSERFASLPYRTLDVSKPR